MTTVTSKNIYTPEGIIKFLFLSSMDLWTESNVRYKVKIIFKKQYEIHKYICVLNRTNSITK